MKKLKEKVSLALVILAYLIFNFRYTPGRPVDSLAATAIQILTTAPYIIGATFLVVYFLQRTAGARLSWDRILRIYCTLGIITGLLFAINEHLTRG